MTREEAEKVFEKIIGPCLCGNPEVVLRFIHKALKLIKARSESKYSKTSNEALDRHFQQREDHMDFYWMAWYFIDRGDVIEHGGNVSGSWLTETGEAFLAFLDEHERYDYQVLEDPLAWDMGTDSKKPAHLQ